MKWAELRRFLNKTLISDSELCWNWEGSKNSDGYGWMKVGTSVILAHRIAWMIDNHKEEIPEGHRVCHRCDNASCVNPLHLFLGTQSDNMKDCSLKGRTFHPKGKLNPMYGRNHTEETCKKISQAVQGCAVGSKNPNCKLNESQVRTIKLSRNKSRQELADQFGVAKITIDRIRWGQQWKHVTI